MNIKYFYIVSAIWIFVAGHIGFSESFPDRASQAEMDEVVRLGTECAHGVNERCWATQYQLNPAQYRVTPFTNTAQWYLDQSLLGTMASKIRSLVPWYANPVTIYNGTTNITMLTVNGVWAQLAIGDRTDKFTLTPASGTNAATYGDSPWRIWTLNLEERYKVLNALSCTFPKGEWWYPPGQLNSQDKSATGPNWTSAKAACDALPWTPVRSLTPAYCYSGGQNQQTYFIADKHLRSVYGRIMANTNIIHTSAFYFKAGLIFPGNYTPEFWNFGLGFLEGKYSLIEEFSGNTTADLITTVLIGVEPSQAEWIAMPWCSEPIVKGGAKGFSFDDYGWFLDWNFQYCK